MRQALAAERDTRGAVDRAADELGTEPEFAILLSCLGRGPYFFGGADRDLEILRQRFPGLPIVGAYGAGQIAPLPMGNRLIHNSALIALASTDVQSEP
jgi:small ligand-binding sensory domain FIST